MAIWKKANREPVTTEAMVRVFCPETGQEGYVSVSWEHGRHHAPRYYGPVVQLDDRTFDEHGTEVAEPRYAVVDTEPNFA